MLLACNAVLCVCVEQLQLVCRRAKAVRTPAQHALPGWLLCSALMCVRVCSTFSFKLCVPGVLVCGKSSGAGAALRGAARTVDRCEMHGMASDS